MLKLPLPSPKVAAVAADSGPLSTQPTSVEQRVWLSVNVEGGKTLTYITAA